LTGRKLRENEIRTVANGYGVGFIGVDIDQRELGAGNHGTRLIGNAAD
jgi:hypothetical protein